MLQQQLLPVVSAGRLILQLRCNFYMPRVYGRAGMESVSPPVRFKGDGDFPPSGYLSG